MSVVTPAPSFYYDGDNGRLNLGCGHFFIAAGVPDVGFTTGINVHYGPPISDIGGFGLRPSTLYTTSIYVNPSPSCPTITLATGYDSISGVTDTNDARLNHPELIDDNGWIRLWTTYRTGPSDSGQVQCSLSIYGEDVIAATRDIHFLVDDVMCEEGDSLLDYFDGSSPSADYLWAGTTSRSSSHYYPGFASNAYRLNDIVQQAVPWGTQVRLLYAQPPS